jgi:uncharacterized protein YciI
MYFMCIRRWRVAREQRATPPGAHLRWMQQQHDQGRILLSGPSPDWGGGVYLIRASSREEASQIAASDPYTAYGDAEFELFHWEIHQALGIGPFTPESLTMVQEENAKLRANDA